jgi:hypothetical protein
VWHFSTVSGKIESWIAAAILERACARLQYTQSQGHAITMDGQLKLRKEMAQKAIKMALFGKAVEHDEADACREEAAAIIAWEMEQEATTSPSSKPAYLHDAAVKALEKELEEAKAKLMYHSSARELALQQEVQLLKERCAALEARAHWDAHYAWTLPGAFLLTEDGECACKRERRLYGRGDSPAAAAGGGSAGSSARDGCLCGRGGSCVHARACDCGNRY